jgi:hypothetical protein
VGAIQIWARMSKAKRVTSLVAFGVISTSAFCCGGLTVLGAIVGPAPQKSPKPKSPAAQVVETPVEVTPSLTQSPYATPTAVPTTPAPVPTTEAPAPPPPPPVATTTTKAAPPPPPPPVEIYYPNCDAVRAAGAAPLYVGQPGYRPALDRDHDGVACE